MGKSLIVVAISLLIVTSVFSAESRFKGTWCIGNEKLVIEFSGKDSIKISSRGEEAINGTGFFTKTDTTFTATIINDDLELKIGYSYKFRDSKTLKAKITFFTVDGNPVDYPKRWLRMQSCNPDTFDFDKAAKEEQIED